MTHLTRAAFLALALPGAALAQQPYSDSMADCAGLYHAGAELVQSEELIARLGLMAARFESAAYVQAQREGRGRPQEVIGARIARTHAEWADKGLMMVFSQDFEDWTGYCRSFAGHVGVDLAP